jgi:hypothetical protein
MSGSRFISLGGSLQEGVELKCSWKRIQRAPAYVTILLQRSFSSSDHSLAVTILLYSKVQNQLQFFLYFFYFLFHSFSSQLSNNFIFDPDFMQH